MKAVITGDIINSTLINNRQEFLSALDAILKELNQQINFHYEIYRGDSIQILIDTPIYAMHIALLLRYGLRKSTPSGESIIWDCRLAIGIGEVNFLTEDIKQSDGEAFQLSGRALDQLKDSTLDIHTPWTSFDEIFRVMTSFVDDIINNTSITQAESMYYYFISRESQTQAELAKKLNNTAQSISKSLIGGKYRLISSFLNLYKKQLHQYLN